MALFASQPSLAADVTDAFAELKRNRSNRAIILKLNENESEILLERKLTKEEDFQAFISAFPNNDIRWAALRIDYSEKGVGKGRGFFFF